MAVSAQFAIASRLALPRLDDSANVDSFDLLTGVDFNANSNTAAQIIIDPPDNITGADFVAEFGLMRETDTFTADAGTDVLNTPSSNHDLAVGEEVRFTSSGTLPAPLTAGVSYFVESVPGVSDFTVAEYPGGPLIDITTAGTGTHVVTTYTEISVTYPGAAPETPTRIMDERDGLPNDFTLVRAIHISITPADYAADASGSGYVAMGDPTTKNSHLNIPWTLDYAIADPDTERTKPSALIVLPEGVLYDSSYPFVAGVLQGLSNANLRIVISLLGN